MGERRERLLGWEVSSLMSGGACDLVGVARRQWGCRGGDAWEVCWGR